MTDAGSTSRRVRGNLQRPFASGVIIRGVRVAVSATERSWLAHKAANGVLGVLGSSEREGDGARRAGRLG